MRPTRQLTAIALSTLLSEAVHANPETDAPIYGQPIIVVGQRQPDPLLNGVQPIDQLDSGDIAGFAVNSINELLATLGPQLAAGGDSAPLVLLNGRRISDLGEVTGLPTESIRRVDVLPAAVALRFGGNASQKVVNFVLRSQFRATSANVDGGLATEGGGGKIDLGGSLTRVTGDNRLSLSARAYASRPLLESQRDIIQPIGSAPDEARFRTLRPEQRRYTLNGTIARRVGRTVNVSASAGANYDTSNGRLGLPISDELAVRRDLDGALRHNVRNFGAFVAIKANADLHRWSLSGTGEYGRRVTNTLTERALPLSRHLSPDRLQERARSRSDSGGVTFVASGPLFRMPAGSVRGNVHTDVDQSSLQARRTRAGETNNGRRDRTDAGAWLSAEVPITRAKTSGALSGLAAQFRAGLRSVSDVGTLRSYSYGLTWAPARAINLNASMKRDRQPPSLIQLVSPTIETSGIRAFDYVRGETVELAEVSGGNPDLRADHRRTFVVGLNVVPFGPGKLRVSAEYKGIRIDNPIFELPAATAEIQAAFPERFIRDSNGALVSIDSRLVNFERHELRQLHWGITWRHRFGGGAASAFGPTSGHDAAEDGASDSRLHLRSSLDYTLVLKDKVLLRRGLSPLDLLHGGATGVYGGQPRHTLQWEVGASRSGIGARLIGSWRSGTTVEEAGGATRFLRFSPLLQQELRLNADLENHLPKFGWARGTRVTVDIANLLDRKQKVRDATGNTPMAYQPDYLDPLGRTVTVSLRRLLS